MAERELEREHGVMSQQSPWTTVSSRSVYTNDWIRVREDQVIRPSGEPGIYGVVSPVRVATGVVALDESGNVTLVGQYRYPLGCYSWEIPEGGADPGEEPLEGAKRELREEAGLVAKSWRQLGGEVHLSNCFTDEVGYLFVATDLERVPLSPDDTEQLQLRSVPLAEALGEVDSGRITDAMSVIALLRLARESG
jgi:8-oxo-dGTP pyrophosphatase MutT (NUDIX family)